MKLFHNSRFWILTSGIILSILIAGFVQLYIPSSSLQTIRIEQIFGFMSLVLLYTAILASPLTKVCPNLFFKEQYLHARRAIGVLAFYYAALHVYLTFFKQLGGFGGVAYLNSHYKLSLLAGVVALVILFIMACTSLDWVVDKLGFKNWKLLHRLVYIASLSVLLHIILIGPHYNGWTPVSFLTYAAAAFLVVLEVRRIMLVVKKS